MGMELQSEKITKFLEVDGAYSGTMRMYLMLQNLNMLKRVNFMLSIFCHIKKKSFNYSFLFLLSFTVKHLKSIIFSFSLKVLPFTP